MNQPDSHPLDGIAPELLEKYSAFTGTGRALRKDEAKRHLEFLQQSAAVVEAELQQLQDIEDRVERNKARNRFEMNYLMEFGVTLFDRDLFEQVLKDVTQHGGLTLHEAAALAHARAMQNAHSSNGVSPESPWPV